MRSGNTAVVAALPPSVCRRGRGLGVQSQASRPATCTTTTTAWHRPATEIDVQGPLADAQLELRARTQQSEFSFTPRSTRDVFSR